MRESGNDQQYAKLHVAVVLMKEFCSGVTVWDIVDFIGRLRRTLLEECPLLEIIRINNPIEEIKNLKFMYLCHCRRLVEGILEARQKK